MIKSMIKINAWSAAADKILTDDWPFILQKTTIIIIMFSLPHLCIQIQI